jgi:hypothetical protein
MRRKPFITGIFFENGILEKNFARWQKFFEL